MTSPIPRHRWLRDALRNEVQNLCDTGGAPVDPKEIAKYLDEMSVARHRELSSSEEEDKDPVAVIARAAKAAYKIIRWRCESEWAPGKQSPDRKDYLEKTGKVYIRPGYGNQCPIIYLRTSLDAEARSLEDSISTLVNVAEEARLSAKTGDGKVVVIADLRDFDFNVQLGRMIAPMLSDNFPGLLKAAYLVNVPSYAVSFVDMVLGLIPAQTRNKFRILQGKKFAEIKEFVDEEDLEIEFGGKDTFFSKQKYTYEEKFLELIQEQYQEDTDSRVEGVYYRLNLLQLDMQEKIVSALADSQGNLISGLLVCSAQCTCQLTGLPRLKMFFAGAKKMRTAQFHPGVECCEAGVLPGECIVQVLPPDGEFELFRYKHFIKPPPQSPDVVEEEPEVFETPGKDDAKEKLPPQQMPWSSQPSAVSWATSLVAVKRASARYVWRSLPSVATWARTLASSDIWWNVVIVEPERPPTPPVHLPLLTSPGDWHVEGRDDDWLEEDPVSPVWVSRETLDDEAAPNGGSPGGGKGKEPEGNRGAGDGEEAEQGRLIAPLFVKAWMKESADGSECHGFVKLWLPEHVIRAEVVTVRVPLHPNSVTRTEQLEPTAGKAYASETNNEVVWEVRSMGEQVRWTEREEATEGGREVSLSFMTLISARLFDLKSRSHSPTIPCHRPPLADSALWVLTQNTWRRRRRLIQAIAILDEKKKPFVRDRTVLERKQREQLNLAANAVEILLFSAFLAGSLQPVRVSALRVHGAASTGFRLEGCLLVNHRYPWKSGGETLIFCKDLRFRFLPYEPPA